MSEADAEYRDPACKILDYLNGNASLFWGTGPWGDDNPFRVELLYFRDGYLIISEDPYILSQFT